ncbi:MAG TPA: MFS transporter [Haliangiales bacterium]|nr:MFS transporter [Haliangiales bacterium]
MRSRWTTLGALFVGYVGVYLCRKNLGVAVPLLQDAFHASKADVGWIASVGEIAYAAGKFLLGPPTERIGGRAAFLGVIGLVALFGGLGGIVPGIALLTVVYGLNRFFGACGWMSMMKVTATWYPHDRATGPVTFLSLSYVLGGVAATLVARALVPWEWHAVMGAPAIATVGLFVVAAAFVWEGPRAVAAGSGEHGTLALAVGLLKQPRFIIVLALSFTVTLLRQAFNTWSVAFLKEVGGGSVQAAALQSIGFDLAGAVSILAMGFAYAYVPPRARGWLVSATLAALAAVIAVLPGATRAMPSLGPVLVAAVGLLVYGPFSLLAGVLAVETGGARMAATAAGLTDAAGYVGGILAGGTLGRLFDAGGYSLGFGALAVVSGVAAVLALGLGRRR